MKSGIISFLLILVTNVEVVKTDTSFQFFIG